MFANDRYFLRPRGPNNRVPPKAPAEAPVPPPPPHLPARRKTVWRFRDRPARRINDADNDGIDHEADAVGQSDLSDSEPESEREPGIVRRDNGDGGAGPLTASMFDCPVCYNLLVDPVTLSCGHTCCQLCIKEWVFQHVRPSYIDPDDDEERAPHCPAGCGAIMSQHIPRVNILLRDTIRGQFPREYAEQMRQNGERDKQLRRSMSRAGSIMFQRLAQPWRVIDREVQVDRQDRLRMLQPLMRVGDAFGAASVNVVGVLILAVLLFVIVASCFF